MALSGPELSKEEEMKIWREKAIQQQSFYCESLKDRTWEKYSEDKNDIIHLQNKLGFVLFGPPKDDRFQDNSSNKSSQEESAPLGDTKLSSDNSDKPASSIPKENSTMVDSGNTSDDSSEILNPNYINSNKKKNEREKLFCRGDVAAIMSSFSLDEESTSDILNHFNIIDSGKYENVLLSKEQQSEYVAEFMNFFFGLDSEDDIMANMEQQQKDNVSENDSEYSGDEGDSVCDVSKQCSTLSSEQCSTLSSESVLEECFSDSSEEVTDLEHPLVDGDGYIMFYSDPEQLKQINELISCIKLCSNNVETKDLYIAFIFVIAKIGSSIAEFPVIRVYNGLIKSNEDTVYSGDSTGRCYGSWNGLSKSKEDSVFFVDSTGRCYESWNNFLRDNFFPECIYCYPKNGFYTCDEDDNVLLEFCESPGMKFTRKFSRVGDFASNIAGLGCGAIVLASLAMPVAGPLLVGATAASITSGIWSTGRAVYELVDKLNHKQKLTDQEARGCWLNFATGILTVASAGALRYTKYLASNGKIIGKVANIVVNGIELSSAGMSGINILHQVYNMYETKTVSAVDTAGLVISLLFFCNTAIKFKTAQNILLEAQNDVINGIEAKLSRRQRKAFKKTLKGTTAASVVERNACVIKTVHNLEDPVSYFRNLSKVTKAANKSKSTVSFSEDASGKLKINGKIKVEPEVINSMGHKSKNKMFHSSKKFNQSNKYNKTFKKDMRNISKKENLLFKKSTFDFQKKMNIKTAHQLRTNGKRIFSSVKPNDVRNINKMFKVIKNDKYYATIKPFIILEVQKSKCSNLYNLFQIIIEVLRSHQNGEAQEFYEKLMKYYEENLSDVFEKVIGKIAEYQSEKMSNLFRDNKENLKTIKHTFFRKVDKESYSSTWSYFEMYCQKLWNFVPDHESVVELRQKVGSLFMLRDNSRVHSVFITVSKLNSDVEKVILFGFMKINSS